MRRVGRQAGRCQSRHPLTAHRRPDRKWHQIVRARQAFPLSFRANAPKSDLASLRGTRHCRTCELVGQGAAARSAEPAFTRADMADHMHDIDNHGESQQACPSQFRGIRACESATFTRARRGDGHRGLSSCLLTEIALRQSSRCARLLHSEPLRRLAHGKGQAMRLISSIGMAIIGTSCLVATSSSLIAQPSAPIPCYDPLVLPPLQQGPCSAYCECPDRTLCAAPNGNSIGGTVTMTSLPCTDYTGGTSIGGRCVGGVPTGLPPACGPVVVAIQACPPDCLTSE